MHVDINTSQASFRQIFMFYDFLSYDFFYKMLNFKAKLHKSAHECKVLGGIFTVCKVSTFRKYTDMEVQSDFLNIVLAEEGLTVFSVHILM